MVQFRNLYQMSAILNVRNCIYFDFTEIDPIKKPLHVKEAAQMKCIGFRTTDEFPF
jgi:hypothetical protein